MEVEFDTRFKHPFSMIVAGSSGSGKTVFTKQVLRSADVEFEKMFWFYSEWQEGYRDCTDVTLLLLLLLSTHSSLIIGGSPLLLSDGGSPPASPASHLAGLLRRRDPSTNPGPIAWWVSVGN